MSTAMRFVTGWSPSALSLLSSSSFPSLWRFSCRPNPLLAQTFTRSLSRLQLISALCSVLSASPPHPHLLAPLPSPPVIWRSLQHYVTSLRYYPQRRASLTCPCFLFDFLLHIPSRLCNSSVWFPNNFLEPRRLSCEE